MLIFRFLSCTEKYLKKVSIKKVLTGNTVFVSLCRILIRNLMSAVCLVIFSFVGIPVIT